jgi:uncharacterized protein (DUF983 family)
VFEIGAGPKSLALFIWRSVLQSESKPSVGPALRAGLAMKCPRCAKAPLFEGYLTIGKACRNCQLDFRAGDTADGPAALIILLVGAIIVGAAIFVEIKFAPPMWLHMMLWLPSSAALTLILLRPFKGALFAIQYFYRAGGVESRQDW